jgi:Flp pilus assembly pilin Flp
MAAFLEEEGSRKWHDDWGSESASTIDVQRIIDVPTLTFVIHVVYNVNGGLNMGLIEKALLVGFVTLVIIVSFPTVDGTITGVFHQVHHVLVNATKHQ